MAYVGWLRRALATSLVLLVAAVVVMSFHDATLGEHPRISPNVPATAMNLSQGPANNSPELVADPSDQRFVVEANRIDSPDFSCALQLSGDGGASWSPARPIVRLPPGAKTCYAPEAAFDGSGVLYYLFIGLAGGGNQPMGVFLTTSADRGRTFSLPRQVLGPANFGVHMAIDRSWGRMGRIHMVWLHASGSLALGGFPPTRNPILSAYSDDGGTTFSKPVQVSDADRKRVVAPSLALGPHHSVHVAYVDLGADARDYEGLDGPVWDGMWSVVVATSQNGGQTFGTGSVVDNGLVPPERVMLIFTMPPPAMVAWSNRVCLSWADARNRDEDIFLRCTRSGRLWGHLVRVNNDRVGDGHRQYLPQLSVSPGGRLDVVYLDRVDQLGITEQTDYTYSNNGGRSFAPSVHLAENASFAGIGARYAGPAAAEQVEFGSRLGLRSDRGGALAAWPDTGNSRITSTDQDIFTTRLKFPRPWASEWAVAALVAAGAIVLVQLVSFSRLYSHPLPTDRRHKRRES